MEGIKEPAFLLEMESVDKAFPGVQALQGVCLDLRAGEVLALLGENGAGKSTLIKILAGIHAPDAGTVRIEGREQAIFSPDAARAAGVAVIHQEFQLIPALNAVENIFLGRENSAASWLDRRQEQQQVEALFARLRTRIPLRVPCRQLSVAQQQMVEIAKALASQARILVMDEPTAALTPQEVQALLQTVTELREQGMGIIYISHRLEEIFQITQRITVLRDGRHVGTHPTQAVTRRELIELMVGRKLENEFPPRSVARGPVRLRVSGLTREPSVRDVSFEIHAGEILGLTGLVGAGRTEVARLIFGADPADAGQIELDNRILHLRNPRDAIRAKICLLTEDRKQQGLLLNRSLLENFGLPSLSHFTRGGLVQSHQEQARFMEYAQSLHIRMANPSQKARSLSGGNQQKVVLAKWLETASEVIIFDEPTRGIDVGAKFEIYQIMNELAQRGKAILMISSELAEILGMSDRILVMHEGRITGEITDVAQATQAQILELAVR